ncbi:MAG: response regulator [Deltaproteobacteria bacterium]|nr:response regulator [Deltaproteobacteria bacterium]
MASQSPKILIVDDEESMVFSIQDYLSSYAECLGATSYDEAISILVRNTGIAAVISDIRMPDKDGFDLLMWLRENRPQVKVVMITAYGSPSVRSLAKQKGAVRYLEKPLDLEQLLQVVSQLLERKGFSVALKDMELADVLQFLSFANKAAKVQIFNPLGEEGEIGLDGEEILWIKTGTKKGEEAFYEILSWQGGSFEVFPLEKGVRLPGEKKISVPLSFLLLEEARRRDEAGISRWAEKKETFLGQKKDASLDIVKEVAKWPSGEDGFLELTISHKDFTVEEKKATEAKWQRPVILDAPKQDIKAIISLEQPVEVQSLLRDIKRESLDLDGFLAEIQGKKYSGEARITAPGLRNEVLFYKGLPLISADRKTPTMREVHAIMDTPDATLNFYHLGDELVHAFLSVFQGEKVWQGLSVSMFQLDKMLSKLMEKNPTGHLCIHKENGDLHYFFFFQGTPLGVYDLEKHWRSVNISKMWEDTLHVDYYLSGKIESFASTAVAMRSSEDFVGFISLWNELVEGIAKKLGKKPVGKSLKKSFAELPFFLVEGTKLRLAGEGNQSTYDALKVFREKAPGFLKEMVIIVGRHWLNDRLREFRQGHSDIIARLSLIEVFSELHG